MLDLEALDLDEIATALQNQHDYEHRILIHGQTGASRVWYEDMADFAEQISDEQAGRRLARAIRGRGAFRHFRDELHEEYPHLVSVWNAFREARAQRRAVEWLVDHELVTNDAAERFLAERPEPPLP
jgi:hypothetical protein